MGSNPVQAWIFFRPSIHYRLSSIHNCEDPFIFTSAYSAVQIYDFHIFTAVYSPLHGFIWNQHDDQHPVGFLAHLVEQCTGIAEVIDSNPVQAWIFFQAFFSLLLEFFPQTFFSNIIFAQTIFSFFFPVFFLFVLNITIDLLNYFTKNLINSTIATYFVDIRSTHL